MAKGHGRDHGIKAVDWWGSSAPTTGPVGTATTWAGVILQFTVPGRVAGFRYYKNEFQNSSKWFVFGLQAGLQVERIDLYDAQGGNPADGWVQVWRRPWRRIVTGSNYRLGVLFQGGHYWRSNSALAVFPVTHNGIAFYSGWQSTAIDPINANPSGNTNANGVDVLFYPD